MPNNLIVDDEPKMTYLVSSALKEAGFAVTAINDPAEALRLIETHSFDIIITDQSMPAVSGINILEKARQKGEADVILMTAYGTVESAVEAMKKGAADYILKPFSMEELVMLCRNLSKRQKLSDLTTLLSDDIKNLQYDQFVGYSRAAMEMLGLISKVAATDTTVLLTGRSGTGKELAA